MGEKFHVSGLNFRPVPQGTRFWGRGVVSGGVCRPHCQQGCAPGTVGTAPGAGGFRALLQLCPSFLPVSQTGVKKPHQHQIQGRAAFQTGQWTLLTKGTTDALGSLSVFPPCEAFWRSDATQAPGRQRRYGEGLLYPHPFRLHILETESTWYYLAFGPQEKKKKISTF